MKPQPKPIKTYKAYKGNIIIYKDGAKFSWKAQSKNGTLVSGIKDLQSIKACIKSIKASAAILNSAKEL